MTDQDQARIDATVRLWLAALREQGRPISGDMRISEADAAAVLGLAPGSLKNLRHEGDAPPAYRSGMDGCRITYRLHDMAEWLERRRL